MLSPAYVWLRFLWVLDLGQCGLVALGYSARGEPKGNTQTQLPKTLLLVL